MVAHIIRSFADCERAMQASQDPEESSRIADLAMGLIVKTVDDERTLLRINSRFLQITAQSSNDFLVHSIFQRIFCPEQNIFEYFRNVLLLRYENILEQSQGDQRQAFAEAVTSLIQPETYRQDGFYFAPQFSIRLAEHPEFRPLHESLTQLVRCVRRDQREEAGLLILQSTAYLYSLPGRLQEWFGLILTRFQEKQARDAAATHFVEK